MLEVKGEIAFKTIAYHRAADAIGRSPVDLAAAYRTGKPPKIPGVGQAISDKIAELVATGHMAYYERLRAEIPPSLVELLAIPGLGPKTVRLVYDELHVETLEDLRQAAEAGTLRGLKGISAKTEQQILAGIEALESRPARRLLLPKAEELINAIVAGLDGAPGLRSIEPAGSFRRRKETIGDLDLLAETDDPAALMQRFASLGVVDEVIGRGTHKSAVRLFRGPQVDLMSMPPGEAGTFRIHFTGSKEHNVKLRAIARDKGWSPVRVRLRADRRRRRAADRRRTPSCGRSRPRRRRTRSSTWRSSSPSCARTPARSRPLGRARLPDLITQADLRGDCHTHSEWSDGNFTIEEMAEACRRRGYAYQVLTDHTQSLAIARGLAPDRVEQQRAIIAELNARFEQEERDGTAPPETPPEGFRLLHGCELEVRADGVLDYPDELLARFDVVVASVHVSRRQPKAELTRRTLNAINSPHVDIVAHPSGRMIQTRDDLDLDWDAVYAAAAETGTALEMNGSPHRLDLSVERARRAVAAGCILTIDSDAHYIRELDYVRWGVSQARRAWVEAATVLNTRSRADLLAWVAGKPARLGA